MSHQDDRSGKYSGMPITPDQERRAESLAIELEYADLTSRAVYARELVFLRDEVERLKAAVPTTWLDSLLSGPKKAFINPAGEWGCPDIEALLNAIRKRMEKPA